MAYPYPMYGATNPFLTTQLIDTFAQHPHHSALESAMHRFSGAFRHAHPDENPVLTPRMDVRETAAAYFIDIELPGLTSRDPLMLRWTSNSTLMLEATTRRPAVQPDGPKGGGAGVPAGSETAAAATATTDGAAAATATAEADKPDRRDEVHHPVRERRVGYNVRALNFPVEVDHEAMKAELKHGLMSLVVPKKVQDTVSPREVEVKKHDVAAEQIPV